MSKLTWADLKLPPINLYSLPNYTSMTPNTNSPFQSWELTLEERAIGYTLSPEQQAVIQNDIAISAIQKLQLKYDPSNPQEFLQKEAELQGTILTLQYMLARSASAQTDLMQELQDTNFPT